MRCRLLGKINGCLSDSVSPGTNQYAYFITFLFYPKDSITSTFCAYAIRHACPHVTHSSCRCNSFFVFYREWFFRLTSLNIALSRPAHSFHRREGEGFYHGFYSRLTEKLQHPMVRRDDHTDWLISCQGTC